jgi:hypothetical protein
MYCLPNGLRLILAKSRIF